MTIKNLAKYAHAHGFNTAIFSGVLMVWDQDGAEAVTTLAQLKQFLGY